MADVDVAVHLQRARRHRHVGDVLGMAEKPNEWAIVCYFYAAYHLMRHSLRTDPVFDVYEALKAIHVDLTPDERTTARHHGRQRRGAPRQWGMIELAGLLYPSISANYELLHQGSITVRYEAGFPLGPAPVGEFAQYLSEIEDAQKSGGLRRG